MTELKQFLIDNIFPILSSLLGGGSFVAYIFERKKNRAMTNQEIAKAAQEEATALTNMRVAYKEFTDDMNQRYDDLSNQVKDLKKKLTDVTSELGEEKKKYNSLKEAYSKLKNSYDNLKKEFDEYKKNK